MKTQNCLGVLGAKAPELEKEATAVLSEDGDFLGRQRWRHSLVIGEVRWGVDIFEMSLKIIFVVQVEMTLGAEVFFFWRFAAL